MQIERMHEWRGNFPPERAAALQAVEDLLESRRKAARRRMLLMLDSRSYERLCGGFTTVLRAGPPRTFAPGRVAALAVAPDMVERAYRRVRKMGDAIKKNSPPDSRFRFIAFAVAQKRPHFLARSIFDAAVHQVFD